MGQKGQKGQKGQNGQFGQFGLLYRAATEHGSPNLVLSRQAPLKIKSRITGVEAKGRTTSRWSKWSKRLKWSKRSNLTVAIGSYRTRIAHSCPYESGTVMIQSRIIEVEA